MDTDRVTYAWLGAVFVNPGMRGRGIATMLAAGSWLERLDQPNSQSPRLLSYSSVDCFQEARR
ncbi:MULTISPECIES: GNAT family N-acetyltransferase [Cryobacterium]|uniref:N-acetyltransferase n=1 Tax=Cryobacterium breve TaxID=1259258 RepID=A0ABY2IUT9_9MICO|nr:MULTISPECIES: GNAT family N-acetyltransferase [Cryobacterium]TFC93402.1 hypothetical protein E3T20_10225 [Cryobacterium sp. TmT3-12]TFC95375.1 hypothetical protein E3O65_15115 [Cryobacterium breve]